MALLPGLNYKLKDRSANARLVVSGTDQLAESFILDPNLPVLFKYPFGWPGMTEVVIPKGLATAVLSAQVDFETGKKKPILTIATGANPYVGIAPYNICKKYDDQLVGNEPTFIRNAYIELPYIPSQDDCALVKYGAAYGALQEGDIVTVSKDPLNKGHLTKWTEGVDSISQIVGQVIAIEQEEEPWGWFKWVMWDETARREDRPEPDWSQNAVSGENGYPYEPDYRDGTIYQTYYQTPYTTKPAGIKGLTDGQLRGSTRVAFSFPAGQTTYQVSLSSVPTLIKNGLVKVYVAEMELPADRFSIDYDNKTVTINLPWAPSDALPGYVLCQSKEYYGTPPGWDYVGAVGVVRILLK